MRSVILIVFAFICFKSEAQLKSYSDLNFNNNLYNVCEIKIDSSSVSKFNILENRSNFPLTLFMDSIIHDTSGLLINASITDSFCQPLGLYVLNSVEIKPINLGVGKGNFYLKPNGSLLFSESGAAICESSQTNNYNNIRLGIQSGPMLIDNGTINGNFNPQSMNKNMRCGVGMYVNNVNQQFLVFAISQNPVSFYEFTLLFKERFNCGNALCLESGNCSMNLPYISSQNSKSSSVICRYIYFQNN